MIKLKKHSTRVLCVIKIIFIFYNVYTRFFFNWICI